MEEHQSFEDVASAEPGLGIAEEFKEIAGDKDFKGYFGKVKHGLSREIEAESRTFTSEQLKSLSGKLDEVAEVLADTARSFRERQKTTLAEIVEISAHGLTNVSRQLREQYAERIASGVEDLVRDRFWIVVGGTFAAGVLLWGLSNPKSYEFISKRRPGDDLPSVEEQLYGPH